MSTGTSRVQPGLDGNEANGRGHDSFPCNKEGPALAIVERFADDIVLWQQSHGRNSLPWQNTKDPYRVWLSEIMLQQTQVGTVLDYYSRFLQRFPTVQKLAAAGQDDVLGLWSGLGYYSRARNLHRCAQDVVSLHGGTFPSTSGALQTLPGIGRSTAAAIASFCFGERVAILDGNVKRVLTRVLAFSADLAQSANERTLWESATAVLPDGDLASVMPRYTQGLMDLGATICTLRKPQCLLCPVQNLCQGFGTGNPTQFPVRTRKINRSALGLSLLWAQKSDGSVWLEKRPSTGIWGGLYCLPVFESEVELKAACTPALKTLLQPLPHFLHVLTHKDLHLAPWQAYVCDDAGMPDSLFTGTRSGGWISAAVWPTLGLPAPVRKLLTSSISGPEK